MRYLHKNTFSESFWLMILYIFINTMFMAKYSMRITSLWPVIVVMYILFQFFVFRTVLPVIKSNNRSPWKNFIKAAAIAGVVIMFAAQLLVDPYTLNVDRWSALHYPIKYLLDGEYPYSAPTHLGGRASPFPVWQLFHIPFYLCNNVGLSFFAALALFLWSVGKVISKSSAWIALALVSSSLAVYYEVTVRSDILANFLLLASVILWAIPYLSLQWIDRHYISISIAIGLFASTRILTVLPIIILLLPYWLKMKPYKMVWAPIVVVCVFAATFLPIVLLDSHEFFHGQYPPWLLQTRQGHSFDFVIFAPLIVWFSLSWHKSLRKYCLLASIYMIIFVAISIVHSMIDSENYDLFGIMYDITYFTAALPFILIGNLPRCSQLKSA